MSAVKFFSLALSLVPLVVVLLLTGCGHRGPDAPTTGTPIVKEIVITPTEESPSQGWVGEIQKPHKRVVKVVRESTENSIKVGDPLFPRDQLRTNAKGRTAFELEKRERCLMERNARVEIMPGPPREPVAVWVEEGSLVYCFVFGLGENSIGTPFGRTVPQNTTFRIDVKHTGMTVRVYDGGVVVNNTPSSDSMEVGAGQEVTVDVEGNIGEPVFFKIRPEEIEAIDSIDGKISETVESPTPPPPPTPTPPPPPTPTPPPPPTPTPPPPPKVLITDIFFDGLVPFSESDEYVEIVNNEPSRVELDGWRIVSVRGSQRFFFPGGATIEPGEKCRIYTNQYHPEWCGFSFGRGSAVWNNEGDKAVLYDQYGRQVDEYSY